MLLITQAFASNLKLPEIWALSPTLCLWNIAKIIQLGISQQFGRSFWSIPAGYFARFRPPISEHFDPLQLGG